MARRTARWLVGLTVVAVLAGCAVERRETPATAGHYKVGSPYQVAGIWYTPVEDYEYDEIGIASWYGPQFDGMPTANGEIFDMNAVSAAHTTLPLPSVVEVTNLENGRTLIVRVNDRGPFKDSRIIDLSKRAAELLGFVDKGTARVRVRVLAEESLAMKMQTLGGDATVQAADLPASPVVAVDSEDLETPPAPSGASSPGVSQPAASAGVSGPAAASQPAADAGVSHPGVSQPVLASNGAAGSGALPGSVFVQAGAFQDERNAARLRQQLAVYGPTRVLATDLAGQRFYRVQLGPFDDIDDGNEMLWTLRDAGVDGARVVVVD